MKIALIMYGLVRDMDSTISKFKNLRFNYFKGMSPDIFCVTNDINGTHSTHRMIDTNSKIQSTNFDKLFKEILPKNYIVIPFEEELKDTRETVDILSSKYTFDPLQPFQNIVSKWYKLNRGLQMVNSNDYDIIVCCRLDCKFIPKFNQSQMASATKLHTLSMLWCAEQSFGMSVVKTEEESQRMSTHGYPEDFFYGPSSEIYVFSEMGEFIKNIDPSYCIFHSETIFNNFLKKKCIVPELIRWSDTMEISDFKVFDYTIEDVGHTYPPTLKTRWITNI